MHLKASSYLRGLVTAGGFNAVASLFGFLGNALMVYYFGAQHGTDVYLFTLATVGMASNVIVIGLNGAVIIPQSMYLATRQSQAHAMVFLNVFFYLYMALGTIIALVVLFDPIQIYGLISGFDRQTLEAQRLILSLSIPLFLLTFLNTHLLDILTAHKLFGISGGANIVTNMMVIGSLFAFHKTANVASAMVGIIAGYLVVLLSLLFYFRYKMRWSFRLGRINLGLDIMKDVLLSQSANVASNVAAFVPQYLLSGLGAGALTAFNLAQRLLNMPQSFIVSQISTVAGIKLNDLGAHQMLGEMNRVFIQWTKMLLLLVVPCSLLVFMSSDEVISLLFVRGAFSGSPAVMAARFTGYLFLLLPLYGLNTMVSRLSMASRRIVEISILQIVVNLASVAACVIAVYWWGPLGVVAGLSFSICVTILAYRPILANTLTFVRYDNLLLYLGKILLMGISICAILLPLKNMLHLGQALDFVVLALAYTTVFATGTRVFRLSEELDMVVLRVKGRLMNRSR